MYMIVLGVVLLVLKVAQFGPVGTWSWFVVLAPFALAVVWWTWADKSGWTKRRAMEKMELKKQNRRNENLATLGLSSRSASRSGSSPAAGFRDVQSAKIEDKRDEIRRKNKATLARSTKPGNLDSPGAGSADSRY
jgi:small Trp-rich protein